MGLVIAWLAMSGCGQTQARVEAVDEADARQVTGSIDQTLSLPSGQLILLNEYPINTLTPELTYRRLPSHLRSPDAQGLTTLSAAAKGGQYLVQFSGAVQDEWLEQLKATGARVVSYVPYNSYVVRASPAAAAALQQLKGQAFVRFVGNYEPGFRLSPEIRAGRRPADGTPVNVVVQVIDDEDSGATIDQLRGLATGYVGTHVVTGFHNVSLVVDAAKLETIAKLDGVFAVERRTEKQRLDEAQGQIVAGNLSAGSPTGPGYLTWLAGKGFNSSQFTGFAVEVTDDAYSLSGHPDLPSTRIAFQNNPTAQSGNMGGHGFLNSHIVGGFNSSTGTAYEDNSGYNYGLGIAPWARVGVTAIFGSTSATPTSYESTAFGQGARISSNSWGYTSVFKYDTNAQEFDRIVRDSQTAAGLQQMVVVFAAGNSGATANTVSSPGTAKNVITVGASENFRQTGTDGCAIANTGADNAEDIISFSSRGPVNSSGGDGRIKPDLVAPGTHIEAGIPQASYDGSSVCNQYWPTGQTLYGWSSGTSHSCPAVAGGSALVYQSFLNQSLTAPSPAMVKAYLMSSTSYMTGVGANDTLPSNNQGMGRMNLGRAFDGTSRVLVDQTQVLGATGGTYQVTGAVSSSTAPFRVTLAWTDAPGPTTGAPWVNNLDLEVTVGGTTYKGNVFSGANSVAGGSADLKNNVESVFLPAGTSGSFTVTVRATGIAGDGVPGNADTTDQDFALVIYNGSQQAPTQPAIGVSPASLGFNGVVGGASPSSQAIAITNAGVGTLSWTASSSATWLSVTPASGTAPSTLTASASTSGMTAGTYSATITLSATGASNTPLAVPVTLTVSPAGQATYDATIKAPLCANVGNTCIAGSSLLLGRANLGPEPSQPNTINSSCADGVSGTFHSDESVDAVSVSTVDGTSFAPGKTVRVDATVWAYSTFSSDHLDLYYAADATAPSWVLIGTVNPTAAGAQTLSATYVLPTGGSRQAVRANFRYAGSAAACTTGGYDDHDDVVFAVGSANSDTTPPTTAITSPAAGATVSGTVTISASASDNVGVTRVEFYVDGALSSTDTTSPYSASWNTTAVANGTHSLTSKAFDAAGNSTTSTGVSVTVSNSTADTTPPTTAITSPAAGATVSGTVTIVATASDNVGVSKVDFYVDGALSSTDTTSPYSASWTTTAVANGAHSLTTRATDAAGNVGTSAAVSVTVSNVAPGAAVYDATLKAPKCAAVGTSCDSGTLLNGRATKGPEANAPNTINSSCVDGTSGTYHVDESLDGLKVTTVDGTALAPGKSVRIDAKVWAYTSYTADKLDLYYAANANSPSWVFIGTLTPTGSGVRTLTTTFTLPAGTLQAIRGQFRYNGSAGTCTTGSYNDRDDLVFAVGP
jgi:hypothetical protein